MASQSENFALIRVVGVGGAGSNAVNRMIRAELLGVEFIAVNTDAQALVKSHAPTRIRIGDAISRGLGAGGDSVVGERAAQEDLENLRTALDGSDLVFVTAGMGGGTGSGAAPVVAKVAKDLGALTIGIITKPFEFEGKRRAAVANAAAEELRKYVDTLIIIPNERLLSVVSRQTSMEDSFRIADDVLRQAVQGVSDVITVPGIINLDFADVRSIMKDAGSALMGIGRASGESRARAAAELAIASPLLELDIQGATGVLVNVAASSTVTLHEVNEAINHITERADREANIIFGTSLDETLADEVQITVIATGFAGNARSESGRASSQRDEFPYGHDREGSTWSAAAPGSTAPITTAPYEAPVQPAPASTWTPSTHPAVSQEPIAPHLASEGVSPAPVAGDELEIPAFLRRRS
ncbi:MAG: cell division protein FtsZ [Chloroflexi bacterium]|jgi:cell division protein FtsZ|nr:MAG: cell division protein FtsZ [Chloroflexota bacterium]